MISIVVCSVDPGKFNRLSAHLREQMAGEPHEIIGIHDARSMCEGYNRGFAKSRGEVVLFVHDDIECLLPAGELPRRLNGHFERFDGLGVVGTDWLISPVWWAAGAPHLFGQIAHMEGAELVVSIFAAPRRAIGGIQGMDGAFLGFRQDIVEKLGWDEKTFTGFHCYDVDMTFRAHLAGYKLGVMCDLPLLHASTGEFGPTWETHARAFVQKHASNLPQIQPRKHQFAKVAVTGREDAMKVMTPVWWEE